MKPIDYLKGNETLKYRARLEHETFASTFPKVSGSCGASWLVQEAYQPRIPSDLPDEIFINYSEQGQCTESHFSAPGSTADISALAYLPIPE